MKSAQKPAVLPARHSPAAVQPCPDLVVIDHSNQVARAARIHLMKIIKAVIADDDAVTRYLLRTLLRQRAIDVVGEASNGKGALQKCASENPDVLFLDINMQEMDGFETLDCIRETMPGLAVIMISSDSTAGNVQKAHAQGADGFIVKPFSPARVFEAIGRCVRESD
jgi:two-component system chemotaxis response regulator CheY